MSWKKVYIPALLALFITTGHAANGYDRNEISEEPVSMASEANSAGSYELLQLINQSRIKQGLPPLVQDVKLTALAVEHAEEMAKQGFISHDLPSGNIFVRMNRAGYNYDTIGENIARSRTISYAHNALLESPSHKENILFDGVTHVGIGIVKGDPATRYGDYFYIVEIFASLGEAY